MRTTIRLDDRLLEQAKKLAASEGKTLGEIIEAALREALHRRPAARQRARPKRVALPTVSGRGLLPGIDLDDSSALLDGLEGRR